MCPLSMWCEKKYLAFSIFFLFDVINKELSLRRKIPFFFSLLENSTKVDEKTARGKYTFNIYNQ